MSRTASATALGVGAAMVAAVSVLLWSTNAEIASEAANARPAGPVSALPTVTAPPADEVADAATVVAVDRCASSTRKALLVDLSDQHLWLCRRGMTVESSPVTTGSDRDPTPTGRWSVYARQTDRWLSGQDYTRKVDRWMPFFGGYGFHDSAWQRIPYGSELVHDKGSHGCVHVPGAMMKRLYDWADVGTTVRIVA